MNLPNKIVRNILGDKVSRNKKKYYCPLCGLERPKDDIYYDGKKPLGCSECAYMNKEN